MTIEREKYSVEIMIKLYCRKKHKSKNGILCEKCGELLEYAKTRLDKCKFGDDKPFCKNCAIHCYNKSMRERIKTVMRFSAPRIIFTHLILAFSHMLEAIKSKR